MQYYILMPGDTEKDALNEANLLGDASFGNFWAGSGLKILMWMVDNQPEALTQVTIKTDQGKSLTVTQFLDSISKLQVRMPK
jgi:hypothetical protein